MDVFATGPKSRVIPFVPPNNIIRVDDLPVMPLIALLLLQLQSWEHYGLSDRPDMRQSQAVAVNDIQQLLEIAVSKGESVARMPWLPRDFLEAGERRIKSFLEIVRPSSFDHWEEIGFDLYSPSKTV